MAKVKATDVYKFLNILESITSEKERFQMALLHSYSKGVPIDDIEISEEMLTSAVTLRNRIKEYTTKLQRM